MAKFLIFLGNLFNERQIDKSKHVKISSNYFPKLQCLNVGMQGKK